jgi:hypothetical protein
MTGPLIVAVEGPRWTRKRLVAMLIDCYGPSPRGAVNVAAVADYAGVAESTVRRWIVLGAGHANNRRPAIPARRLTQLQLAPPEVEERSEQAFGLDLISIANIAAGRNLNPYWLEHGWLNDHTVAVIAVAGKPWHQVVFHNGSPRAVSETRRRGTTIDSIAVPSRLHARVVAHAVMLTMGNWRVHPAEGMLKRAGSTTVWMDDAPPVDLNGLARQLFAT